MYYVAGSPSELVTPKLGVTNGITGASLTISGTSALDTITSDKDITFTSGTSGGTGLVYDATLGTDGTYSGRLLILELQHQQIKDVYINYKLVVVGHMLMPIQ